MVSFEVGSYARVTSDDSDESHRAIVATIADDAGDPTEIRMEVIFPDNILLYCDSKTMRIGKQLFLPKPDNAGEEVTVPASQVKPLKDFELEQSRNIDDTPSYEQVILNQLKQSKCDIEVTFACIEEKLALLEPNVKALISQKDYDAAIEQICVALSSICQFSVGSAVCHVPLELEHNEKCKPPYFGTVMTYDENTAELLLEDENEIVTNRACLIPIPVEAELLNNYMKLLLQLAQTSLRKNRPYVQLAWRITAVILEILDKNAKDTLHLNLTAIEDLKFQANMLKARAHILGQKYKAAAVCIRAAVLLRPRDMTARKLVKIIQQRKKRQILENKKLVREIAKWVQKSMDSQPEDVEELPIE